MSGRHPRLNLALFLIGVVTIAIVINGFAARPGLRFRGDATKTRAYSLSPQTRQMLAGLDGQWTIALVMSARDVDDAVRRQVDEVLSRFTEASEAISVVRVDPTDPRTLPQYELLLADLRAGYAEQIADYQQALAEGRRALESFKTAVQQQSGRLAAVVPQIAAADPNRRAVEQLQQVLALRLEQAGQVIQELDGALRSDESRPLPDYEAARSVLGAALGGWAEEQFRIGQLLAGWQGAAGADLALRRFAADDRQSFEAQAQQLALAADPLKQLPALELGRIGRALEQGDAAIVMGPRGAAVIPSAQLLPNLAVRSDAGSIAYDQRFRGEQMISATIRSLLVDQMPMVVFVHAQDQSLLARRDRNVDLVGSASILDASRFDVREWIVDRSDPPTPAPGQTAVWIVVPPPSRQSLEPTGAEIDLIEETHRLLDDGQPVLLSFHPSVLPRFGRADPWATLTEALGVEVETGEVVAQEVAVSPDETRRELAQTLEDFPAQHPIASALHGQRTYLALPVAIVGARPAPGTAIEVIGRIAPSPARWLEPDWSVNPQEAQPAPHGPALAEPVTVIAAIERRLPDRPRPQRVIVVGSGGWMLSYVADVGMSIGGDRVMLAHPGNYELLLSSVEWLAGMDELIAPSPVSRQVARLGGVTPAVQQRWRWISLLGIPGACVGLGVAVWSVRRR